jgi:hypothetical protein
MHVAAFTIRGRISPDAALAKQAKWRRDLDQNRTSDCKNSTGMNRCSTNSRRVLAAYVEWHAYGAFRFKSTTMATRPFIRMLEVKLDEAFFVFSQLPKQLNGAARRLGLHALRTDVLARASVLGARASKLITALSKWGGRKPAPCDCADLATELNDLRYASKTTAPERWLYSKALHITNKLTGMVHERLVQARRLAILLGERVLAADIKELLEEEPVAEAQLNMAEGDHSPSNGT